MTEKQIKEQWKEELSGAVFSHEKTFDDTVLIKITSLSEKLYIGFLGNPFVITWNEEHGDKWILEVNCWYNTSTGAVEYEGGITLDKKTCYTNLEIDEVLQSVIDEQVKLFWRKQKEKLLLIFQKST